MNKKEFYEKYIQSEDEKMMEIIHKNAHKNDGYKDDPRDLRFAGVLLISMIFVVIMIIVGVLCLK